MNDLPDDRVTCATCRRTKDVTIRGKKTLLCGAFLGEADSRGVRHHTQAISDIPLRCFFYVPLPSDPDPRRGRERWPCTEEEYREAHRRRLTVWWAWMLPSVDKRHRGG